MLITKRTKLSLCQLLGFISQSEVSTLLEKHSLIIDRVDLESLKNLLFDAKDVEIVNTLNEIVLTKGYLRKKAPTGYVFDERWADFEKCLLLDGYRIEQNRLVKIEPFIESKEPIEDDLTKEIQEASLSSSDEILRLVRNSAEQFKNPSADLYSGCLTESRVALELLVKEIAIKKGCDIKSDASKVWGTTSNYLNTNGFFSEKEKNTVTSIYTFISEGAHQHLGLTDKEFARFGRNLAISVCYYIVKKLNGKDMDSLG